MERKHKYLLETARTLLYQSKLPIKYWGECILTATYIINRLASQLLGKKCLYEILHNTKPSYSHLRSFGCLCFPTTLKSHKDKFKPRAIPHIFIGHPFNTKGYKVLDLSSNRIHVSRDVLFHEDIFPFVISPTGSSFNFVLQLITGSNSLPSSNSYFRDVDFLDKEAQSSVLSEPVPTYLKNNEPSSPNHSSLRNNKTPPTSPQTEPVTETTYVPPVPHPIVEPRRSSRIHVVPGYL